MKNKSHLFLLSMAIIILTFSISSCSSKKQNKTDIFSPNQEVSQSWEIKNEVKAYKLGDEKKLLADWNEENPPLNDSWALVISNLPTLFSLHWLKHKNLEFNFQVLTWEISARIDIIFPKNLNKTRIPLWTWIKAGGTLKIKLGDYQQFFNPKAWDIALIISATKNGKKDWAENTYVSYTTVLWDEKVKDNEENK